MGLIFGRGVHKKNRNLKDLAEENLDILYYINDIFLMGRKQVNDCVANALILATLNPILIASFTDCKKGILSLKLALYLIPLLLNTLHYSDLTDWLLLKIFSNTYVKNEFYLKVATNNFSMQALKESLGLELRGKSPLETSNLLKDIIRNEKDIDVQTGENRIKPIILSFLKVCCRVIYKINA